MCSAQDERWENVKRIYEDPLTLQWYMNNGGETRKKWIAVTIMVNRLVDPLSRQRELPPVWTDGQVSFSCSGSSVLVLGYLLISTSNPGYHTLRVGYWVHIFFSPLLGISLFILLSTSADYSHTVSGRGVKGGKYLLSLSSASTQRWYAS